MAILDSGISAWLGRMSKKRSRQGLYEFLATECRKIPSASRVLIVGSGGEIGRLLAEFGDTVGFYSLSLDIDPGRNPNLIGDICTYDFGNQTFDVVVISEVLEHLHSPQAGLDNIYSILKAGGKLILSTPFILPIHDQPNDYFRFTRHGLALLLKKFRNVEISERNSYFEAIDVLWVRLFQIQHQSAGWASFLIIPVVYFLKRPISLLLSRLIQTDAMTTGYVATAIK